MPVNNRSVEKKRVHFPIKKIKALELLENYVFFSNFSKKWRERLLYCMHCTTVLEQFGDKKSFLHIVQMADFM